ncbi:MAG TPA: DoxX family protein [Pyrinomonadaceae bacterium]|nr:DoxX family protein [Pyrinomonadaceae bacterium]
MNIVLWIIQILLALLFLFAGGTKLIWSAADMQAMASPNQVQMPILFIRFIGVVELLGALGLVLPGLLRIKKGLTPLAAIGLTIIMVGAVIITIAGDGIALAITPLIVALLCAFVAYGRRNWRSE